MRKTISLYCILEESPVGYEAYYTKMFVSYYEDTDLETKQLFRDDFIIDDSGLNPVQSFYFLRIKEEFEKALLKDQSWLFEGQALRVRI